MASVLVNTRETSEDQLDWLQKHRAREVDQLRKENGQLCGELQRLRAQLAQLKNLEEKAQRHERQELQLQKGVEEMQVELDQSEQRCEQQQQQISGLQEQLTTAKANEAELESLRERVRRSDEDLRVLNAKVMDLTAEREEAKRQLIRSDKVCTELLQEMKDRQVALELLKQENKELQLAERSRLENHQHEIQVLKNEIHQLITECQSLRHQVSDSNKAQELFEERLKSKDQQIQTQDVELQRSRREAEEIKNEWEARWTKAQEEVAVLQKELHEKVRMEHELKEKASILEAQVQHHLQEEHRLRQDVLRLQTLADERGLTVEKVQKREDSSTEKASELQKRLQELQASLLAERSKLRETEGELHRARESLSFARKELDDVKLQGEVARREALRRSDEKVAEELSHTQQLASARARRAEEQVADRDAEIMRLDRELVQCRGHLAQRDKEATQLAMELRAAGLREGVLEQALEQAAKHKVKAEASWHQARRQLQELSAGAQLRPESFAARRHLGAFTDSPGRLRLGRQVDLDGRPLRRAVPPRATSEPRSVNVRSPVRGEQRVAEPLTEPAARVSRSLLPQEPVSSSSEPLERTWHPEEGQLRHSWPEGLEMWQDRSVEAPERELDGLPSVPSEEFQPKELRVRLPSMLPQEDELQEHPGVPDPLRRLPEDSQVRSRCSQAQLDLWKRRLQSLDQRQLLLEVWHAWSSTAKVFAFRARLELVLLDELRLAKVREEAKLDPRGYLATQLRSSHWPEGTGPAEPDPPIEGFAESKLASLKSFIFEFRQRVAESVAELPGASQAAYGLEGSQALVKTLELGRGAFGRLLHAALFLYQKLRTLVPTELEVTMRDPLSRLVPVPFYVLPYKVPPKIRLAVQEVGQQRSVGGLARSLARGGRARPGSQLEELQDLMPLCASDRTAMPGFLAQLLRIRGDAVGGFSAPSHEPQVPEADQPPRALAGGPGYRDGLDQLVVDALTVYMSGWRLSRGAGTAVPSSTAPAPPDAAPLEARAVSEPTVAPASGSRRARSQGDPRHGMKLRLGPDRPLD